jgi:hypothetical protein
MANCEFCSKVLSPSIQDFCNSNCQRHYWRQIYSLDKYNTPAVDYQSIFDGQSGNCAICGTADSVKPLVIDYDYENEELRGFLCCDCKCLLKCVEKVDDPASYTTEARAYLAG